MNPIDMLTHLSDGLRHFEGKTIGGRHDRRNTTGAYRAVWQGLGAWLSIEAARTPSSFDKNFAVRSMPVTKSTETDREMEYRATPVRGRGPKTVETVAAYGPTDPTKLVAAPPHAREIGFDELQEHAENLNTLLEGAMKMGHKRVNYVTVRGGNLAAFTPYAGIVVPDTPAVFDHGVGATMAVHVADLWQSLILSAIPRLVPDHVRVNMSAKAWHDDLSVGVRIDSRHFSAVLLMRRKPVDPRIDAVAQTIACEDGARFKIKPGAFRSIHGDVLLAVREGRVTVRGPGGSRELNARGVRGEASVRIDTGDLWAGINRLDDDVTIQIPAAKGWPVLAYDSVGTRYTMLLERGS